MVPDTPWPRALLAWTGERFPPAVYTLLVFLFWGSATLLVQGLTGEGIATVRAAVVAWLFFLHLRIFDEHKDFARDVVDYPDRVLSRGVVTLPMLARLGAAAIVAQVVLAASLGRDALVAWLAAFGFSVAMRYEFGVGQWLERHIVLYALTHNPVVAGLAVFLFFATGADWSWTYLWYVGVASFGSLAFELGRKTRLPDEEHHGVASYTTELGQAGARALLAVVYVVVWACVSGQLYALAVPDPWPPVAGLCIALPGLATAIGSRPAKQVEAGASLVLLLAFVAVGVGAWGVS